MCDRICMWVCIHTKARRGRQISLRRFQWIRSRWVPSMDSGNWTQILWKRRCSLTAKPSLHLLLYLLFISICHFPGPFIENVIALLLCFMLAEEGAPSSVDNYCIPHIQPRGQQVVELNTCWLSCKPIQLFLAFWSVSSWAFSESMCGGIFLRVRWVLYLCFLFCSC